jgi:hypothetical protein
MMILADRSMTFILLVPEIAVFPLYRTASGTSNQLPFCLKVLIWEVVEYLGFHFYV